MDQSRKRYIKEYMKTRQKMKKYRNKQGPYDRLTKEMDRLTTVISEAYERDYFIFGCNNYVIRHLDVIQQLQEQLHKDIVRKQQIPVFATTLELAFDFSNSDDVVIDGGPHLLTPLLPVVSVDEFGYPVDYKHFDTLSYVAIRSQFLRGRDNLKEIIGFTIYIIKALNRDSYTEALLQKYSNKWILCGYKSRTIYLNFLHTMDRELQELIKDRIKEITRKSLYPKIKDAQWFEIKVLDGRGEVELFKIRWVHGHFW